MNEQYNHMMSSRSPLLLIGNIIYVSALNRLIDIVTWSPTFQESSWNLFYSSFMGVGVNNPGELDHTGQYGRQVISHWTLQQQPVRSILFFQSHLLLFIDFELFRPDVPLRSGGLDGWSWSRTAGITSSEFRQNHFLSFVFLSWSSFQSYIAFGQIRR